jgi:predicted amidohydrolase YtcJ
MTADVILRRGRFTTLDRSNPTATAVAITDGRFTAVGRDEDVMRLAGASTRTIDLKGRRALPGLIDNHLHIIRGGLNFNIELRWDGVRSLSPNLRRLRAAERRHRDAKGAPQGSHELQLRQRLQRPRPRSRDSLVEQIANRRSEVVLGCARLRLLGGMTFATPNHVPQHRSKRDLICQHRKRERP